MTLGRWGNALRVSIRSLDGARLNAATAVLVLSVASAAGHAVTAVWDSTVERPLSWRNADQIVEVTVEAVGASPSEERTRPSNLTDGEVAELKESATSLSWIGFWTLRQFAIGGQPGHARLAIAAQLSPGAFDALGAVPLVGRLFDDSDHRGVVSGSDTSTVVILREELAAALFGSASSALGETLEIGQQRSEVVGVMPRDFVFPMHRVVAWLPMSPTAAAGLIRSMPAHARLAENAAPAVAAAEATAILRHARLRSDGERVVLSPYTEGLTERIRPTLEVLRAGALLLLLVAAASVASLRLSRALSEQRSSGIRRGLGATPGDEIAATGLRIVLLAGLVAAGTLAVSTYLLPLLRAYGAHLLFAEDWSAGAHTAVPAFATALVAVTLAEAPSLIEILRERSSALTTSARGAHARRPFLLPLLAAGTAASTVILIATAVLAGSAFSLLNGRGGYADTELAVLTVDFGGRGAGFAPGDDDRRGILDELVERLEALPAVERSGYGEFLPDDPSGRTISVQRSTADEGTRIAIRKVSPGMLEALRIPVLSGRGLLDSDRASGEAVAVVDQAFAAGAANGPVGDLVGIGFEQVRVVGVVAEVRAFPARARRVTVYRPYADESHSGGPLEPVRAFLANAMVDKTEVVVRFRGGLSPERLGGLAAIPKTVDPSLRVLKSETVRSRRTGMLGSSGLASVVLVVFSLAGLLLAVVGVVGHISDTAAREAQPNAVRLALGAEPAIVVWQVVRRTGAAAAVGVSAGLLLGWLLARAIGSRIPWVLTDDLFLYLGPAALATLLMAAGGLYAGVKAAKSNPWAVLRSL